MERKTKIVIHGRRDLRDIQREMVKSGELVNSQTSATPQENAFGQALIEAGIAVIPQFSVDGRSYDFKVEAYPILIEVDGFVHEQQHKRYNDYKKDRFVQRRGYRVLRFTNQEVTKETGGAVGEVKSMMAHCGWSAKEVHLYPLTIPEQIKIWWARIRGKEDPYQQYVHAKNLNVRFYNERKTEVKK